MIEKKIEQKQGIVFENVSFAFGKKTVLQNVSFHAPAGKTTVLFGPSGVGKTTCLRITAGFERLCEGRVLLDNKIVSSPSVHVQPGKRKIGFCFQEPALWPALTLRRHLEVVLQSSHIGAAKNNERIQELLSLFELNTVSHCYPNQLSGGEQKRLEFARALAMNPGFLLLDEPLSSVEGPIRDSLSRLINLCRAQGVTTLFVTHRMDEAFSMGNQIVIFSMGKVLRSGTPQEVFRDPHSRHAAELLGYRNFFTVHFEKNTMKTPFGYWKWRDERNECFGAFLPNDLLAEKKEDGKGIIQESWFAGQGYWNHVSLGKEQFVAFSDHHYSPGTVVSLRGLKKPVLLGEE